MKITKEETALFPVLRYFFKDQNQLGDIINRKHSYVAKRMSRTTGLKFTRHEQDLIIRSICRGAERLELNDFNRNILFSERFNPEEKNSLIFYTPKQQITIEDMSEVSA